MSGKKPSVFRLIDIVMLVLLLLYVLVAVLLAAGTTFDLTIIPTLLLGVFCLAAILWWSRNREFLGRQPMGPGE